MSKFSSEQLYALLRAAESRALTEAEEAMLQKLLATDDGKRVALMHQHLRSHYVASGQDTQWSGEELRAISAEISTALPRQKRRKQITNITQQLGLAAITIAVVVGFIFSWPFSNQDMVAPVLQSTVTLTSTLSPTTTPTPQSTATATAQPTATLNRNYVYVRLLDEEVTTTNFLEDAEYTEPLDRVLDQWEGELYLPQQMQSTMSFRGARLNERADVLELAFVLAGASGEVSFILAQSSAENRDITPPLPVIYQPLPRVDVTTVYDDEATTVGEFPAHAYQYENVLRDETNPTSKDAAWVVYNTITWQQEEQLFTLYWIDESLVPSRTLATLANNFQLMHVGDR